jgi:hypothetical protein
MSEEQLRLRLGVIAEDRVTGITGTVTQIHEMLTGMNQVAIQPKGDGKTVPDALCIDEFIVKVLEEGIADTVPAPEETSFKLGQEVRDIVTGQVGKITCKVTHLNGCVYFMATANSKKNDPAEAFYVSHKRLELVSKGVAEKVVKTERSGGPSRRLSPQKAF